MLRSSAGSQLDAPAPQPGEVAVIEELPSTLDNPRELA